MDVAIRPTTDIELKPGKTNEGYGLQKMPRRNLFAATVIVSSSIIVVACAATPPKYEKLAKQPTPSIWASPSPWPFTIEGRDHQGETLTLFFGNELVPACAAGAWRLATMMGTSISNPPLEHWYTAASAGGAGLHAAYQLVGRNLHVVLNAPVCDKQWVLRGTVSETGATGRFATEGPSGGEILGTFATALAPKLLFAHELQMPIEQEALQRQYDALRAMMLPKLEYHVSGPVSYLQGDTGIVLPKSVRTLKPGDSAAEVFALFKDLLLAKGTEIATVEKIGDPTDVRFALTLSFSIRDIPVYRGSIDVVYDPATLRVTSLIAGHFVPDRGLPRTPRLSAREAERIAAKTLVVQDVVFGIRPGTHLTYYIGWSAYPAQRPDGSRSPDQDPLPPHLAWVVTGDGPWDELRVIDAVTGEMLIAQSGQPTN
jgi:hypothetical protein